MKTPKPWRVFERPRRFWRNQREDRIWKQIGRYETREIADNVVSNKTRRMFPGNTFQYRIEEIP